MSELAGRQTGDVNAGGPGAGTAGGESGILGSSGANPSGSDMCRGGQHIPGSSGAETPRKPKPGTGVSDSHGIWWE